jgi:predicted RNase H-like HicB family nuclease
MHKYLIIIEKTETGFSAYSPDLLGCVSTGATRPEVEANMREAIEFHLEGMQEEGYPIPKPSSESAYLEVAS